MLELLYIGRFDYLARRDIHKPSRLPDDIAVEAALKELDTAKRERKEQSALGNTTNSERQTNKRH